ncbi:DNA circularization N-terminal domain-containing protein [Brevibacillus porteri]|uniref:DNA circularization N-terminal domain-containing protein n=1 Tax=Brevibacillus porteri TaxID=2126350 RepID=UPI00370B02F2
MALSFESNRGTMKWPYNPQQIKFSSTKLIVEHEYPHRQGAETEDMGRKSVRVDVSGIFLQQPSLSPKALPF